MENLIENNLNLTDEDKIKAAYALNMCTVSVSQIVDYNDKYILEQEYDAILNNLNLEQIPKDEALLNILTELLNTITFFRIQEIKKQQIEKKYERRLSKSIWSAVPKIGLIVAGGNPITTAISLASQIGIGYMNYRKEKADAKDELEDKKIELEITALEQFDAIKRELFTTAWRLADKYNFPDRYRLTEKQIKHYSDILMDNDELRKYERLETIQNNFEAYPPFWYFFGHTANFIARSEDLELSIETRQKYSSLAKEYFEKYTKLNKYNILREDQISASCHLEYAELLLGENSNQYYKISENLKEAIKKSGYDKDVLQIAAINYIRISNLTEAAKYLKMLVNEDYNKLTNARLLSRIYTTEFLKNPNDDISFNFDILSKRVDPCYLFPFPKTAHIEDKDADEKLQDIYNCNQLDSLPSLYNYGYDEYIKKLNIKVKQLIFSAIDLNNVIDIEDENKYFSDNPSAEKKHDNDIKKVLAKTSISYADTLGSPDFLRRYIDLLNEMLKGLDELSIFKYSKFRKDLKLRLILRVKNIFHEINVIKSKNKTITFEAYKKTQELLVLPECLCYFTKGVKLLFRKEFESIKENNPNNTNEEFSKLDLEMVLFCEKNGINIPYTSTNNAKTNNDTDDSLRYIRYSFFPSLDIQHHLEKLIKIANDYSASIFNYKNNISFYIKNEYATNEFDNYFENANLDEKVKNVKYDTFAILDDKTSNDRDLLFTTYGIVVVKYDKKIDCVAYNKVSHTSTLFKDVLRKYDGSELLKNSSVNICKLYDFIKEVEYILSQQ